MSWVECIILCGMLMLCETSLNVPYCAKHANILQKVRSKTRITWNQLFVMSQRACLPPTTCLCCQVFTPLAETACFSLLANYCQLQQSISFSRNQAILLVAVNRGVYNILFERDLVVLDDYGAKLLHSNSSRTHKELQLVGPLNMILSLLIHKHVTLTITI